MNKASNIFLLLLFPLIGFSQVPELGITAGGSYYLGDLNPYKHFYQTNFGGSLFFRNQIFGSDRLSYRLSLGYGKVEAYDSESEITDLVNRNLNFSSTIVEIGPMIEINFLPYEIGSNERPGTPYMFLGLHYFKMNPKGMYNGDWIELQSLGTEGQGTVHNNSKKYKLNQLSLPIGVGMRFNLGGRIALGLEYGMRKTFTDYLDDVSGNYINPSGLIETNGVLSAQLADQSLDNQSYNSTSNTVARGNSNNKDWYVFAGATLSFRLVEYTTCSKSRKR